MKGVNVYARDVPIFMSAFGVSIDSAWWTERHSSLENEENFVLIAFCSVDVNYAERDLFEQERVCYSETGRSWNLVQGLLLLQPPTQDDLNSKIERLTHAL